MRLLGAARSLQFAREEKRAKAMNISPDIATAKSDAAIAN